MLLCQPVTHGKTPICSFRNSLCCMGTRVKSFFVLWRCKAKDGRNVHKVNFTWWKTERINPAGQERSSLLHSSMHMCETAFLIKCLINYILFEGCKTTHHSACELWTKRKIDLGSKIQFARNANVSCAYLESNYDHHISGRYKIAKNSSYRRLHKFMLKSSYTRIHENKIHLSLCYFAIQ